MIDVVIFFVFLPFVLAAAGLAVMIITLPIQFIFALFLYEGDWCEMMDMEFGTNFKSPHIEPKTIYTPIDSNVVHLVKK